VSNAVVIAARGFRLRSPSIRDLTVLAAAGVLAAGFNDASFSNYNHDVDSYITALDSRLVWSATYNF